MQQMNTFFILTVFFKTNQSRYNFYTLIFCHFKINYAIRICSIYLHNPLSELKFVKLKMQEGAF